MRMKRIRGAGSVHYHCMSRITGGLHVLGEEEKEVLRRMLWQVAEFCGVEVLTYAVMNNHFHVLVFVPQGGRVEDAELIRRYEVLYGKSRSPWHPGTEVLSEWLAADSREGRLWRSRLLSRMGEVSAFMKTLKQRFAMWYNRTHGRYGTLWSDRFKSVLVEGDPRALATVAAYIDLNPVRAGVTDDPAAYRWCGYAEAMGGGDPARRGLRHALGGVPEGSWATVAASYRRLIFGKGVGGASNVGRIDRRRAAEVCAKGGVVSRGEALRCRVRYFTDGAVLGSKAFVRAWIESNAFALGRSRAPQPRPMEGADWEGLTVLRGLRREVIS
jgi:putative transposase